MDKKRLFAAIAAFFCKASECPAGHEARKAFAFLCLPKAKRFLYWNSIIFSMALFGFDGLQAAGLVVAGLAIIALVLLFFFFLRRKKLALAKTKRKKRFFAMEEGLL